MDIAKKYHLYASLSACMLDKVFKMFAGRKERVSINLSVHDIKMPEMSGFETCRRIKASERTRNVPVIFISAMQDVEDKLAAFKAGGVDYVTKPFQAEEVLIRVKTHIELYWIKRDLERRVAALESGKTA